MGRTLFWWPWVALLLLALGVRLGAGVWWQGRITPPSRFRFGDSESYWQLGQAIAQGNSYLYGEEKYQIFRTPGYPLLLAGLFTWVGDGRDAQHQPDVLWGRALSALLGTLAVVGVGLLAWKLFGPKTALAAAMGTALYPEAIALSVFVLSEAPFCPLMLGQLIAWSLAWKSNELKSQIFWSILAGTAAGLATLMRPSWLLFTPFALLLGMLAFTEKTKQLRIGLVAIFALSVTMLPWWVRNYQVAGRFVPTSLQVGASLYDGLSPKATGESEMSFVPLFVREQQLADQQTIALGEPLKGIFEDRLDQRMKAAAILWAKEHPAAVLRLAGVKFLRMWSPLPNAAEFGSLSIRLTLALTYTPVLLLALWGAWKFALRDWPYFLCLIPAVYFTCLHVIFVSSIRYRQPAMLPLLVLAAAVIVAHWERQAQPAAGISSSNQKSKA